MHLSDGTEECNDWTPNRGIQCCSLDGSSASFPDCIENADYETAARKCSEEGLRLCSKEEALNLMYTESDCPIDLVWTSSKCSLGMSL